MKTKLILLIGFILSACSLAGCVDSLKEHLDEYSTIMYFRNSGEQKIELYSVNEATTYDVYVVKAGNDQQATAHASVAEMSAMELMIYNDEHHTEYKLIPSSCYTLSENDFQFAANEQSKKMVVTFDILAIREFADENYIIPLLLTSENKTNKEKSVLLLTPFIHVPKVSFSKDNSKYQIDENSAAMLTDQVTVNLDVDNEWAFDCIHEIDEELLREYNTENATGYSLMDKDAYTIGTAKFTEATSSADMIISIDKSKLIQGGKYAIPIRLKGCSNSAMGVDEKRSSYILFLNYTSIEKNALIQVDLKTSMITTNSKSTTGFANTIDDNPFTYFESSKEGTTDGGSVYYQTELPIPVTKSYFSFMAAHNNYGGCPNEVCISVSADGNKWTKVTTTSNGLPVSFDPEWSSPIIKLPSEEPYRFIRMESLGSSIGANYFALAEFKLYANLPGKKDIPEIQLSAGMLSANSETDKPLENAIDRNLKTHYQSMYFGTTDGERIHFRIDLAQTCSMFYTSFIGYFNPTWAGGSFDTCPAKLKIQVSSDGTTWRDVLETSKGLPVTVENDTWTSPVLFEKPFKHVRIISLETNPVSSFNHIGFTEFYLYAK